MQTNVFSRQIISKFTEELFLDKDQSQFRKKHPRTSDSECYPIFSKRNMYLKKNKKKSDIIILREEG